MLFFRRIIGFFIKNRELLNFIIYLLFLNFWGWGLGVELKKFFFIFNIFIEYNLYNMKAYILMIF